MSRKLLFLFLLCFKNLKVSRSLQASNLSTHSYYVVVSSQIHDKFQKCVGLLIRKDFILTSAHCVRNDDGKKLKATVLISVPFKGDVLTESAIKVLNENRVYFTQQVQEIITHNRYLQNPRVYDIALLRVNPDPSVDCWKIFPILLPKLINKNVCESNVDKQFKFIGLKFSSSAVLIEEKARIVPHNRCDTDDKTLTFCARISTKAGSDGRFSGLLVDDRGVLLGTFIGNVYDKNGLYSGSKFVNVSSHMPWISKELNERK